ncbi:MULTISPECIES: acyl carrier protein [Protofrankia]|uniref:Phosphopantetheine-binding protein n=1 Tax=Candidatus Protofrankia datiscae TaxID=2716812 RepID=F8AXC3_9ACTN|nr:MULTISPECIES: acyl carrier protein [Protofrankia]AEH09403.1 phosphopantetheine-binding protein [Candidatus Protofrankia datiscae]
MRATTGNLKTTVGREELRALVADALERSPAELADEADLVGEFGLDSLAALEIVVRLEKLYRIRVKDEEFAGITSLDRIHDLLTTKLKES